MEMNVLTLSIKQNFFDEIIEGSKTFERREIRPTNEEKYCEFSKNGEDLIGPKAYTHLKLVTGQFKGKRPYIIVEVAKAEIIFWKDEETGELITFEYEGETHVQASVEYTLGKVVEKFIN